MRLHDENLRGFASDNCAGAHPEILAALAAANGGHQRAYGKDVYTEHLIEVMRAHFGEQAEVFPMFNGTGANVTALTSLLPRWGAAILTSRAHIHTDENGAPERVGGIKLLTVDSPDGKLTVDLIDREAWGWGNEHRAQPLAVSVTQSTELGTLYSADEIHTIAEHVHAKGMTLHMDGARIANAAAALDMPLREFTTDAGVDILSLGGTKNGILYGEAIVVLNPGVSGGLTYLRKMNMQLASKMRFVSAQLIALFGDDLYLRSAGHANAMAARLRRRLEEHITAGEITGLGFSQPTQVNAVLAVLANDVADHIREKVRFYDWNRAAGEVRWMTSFDTTEADVDEFVKVIRKELVV
jgi:threonine aldolase